MSDYRINIILLLMIGAFTILPYMHLLGWRMEIEITMDHSWALMIILVVGLVALVAIIVVLTLSITKPHILKSRTVQVS
jgi:hypothetical protein